MEAKNVRYVGIDLAKRSYVAKMDDPAKGKIETWYGKTSEAGIEKLLGKLSADDRVAMECCSFAFHLAKRIKNEVGCEVYVLNAGQLAIIYKSTKKTDLEDAAKITWLLHRFPVEELPTVTLPTEEEEHRRAQVSELRSKKSQRTALVNRLHSVFVRIGITGLEKKDLKTETIRADRIEKYLTGYTRTEALRIQEELGILEKHIEAIEEEMTEDLKTEPLAKNLLSIPGIGKATAMAFLAHVGNGSRFSNGRQVAYFVGITPRVDNSGESVKLGNITKRGCSAIRALIVQSAWAAMHSKADNPLKGIYKDLSARRGKGIAIVAIARRLLELMWIVVSRNELYRYTTEEELNLKLRRLGLIPNLKKKKGKMEPAA
jgi:transposase